MSLGRVVTGGPRLPSCARAGPTLSSSHRRTTVRVRCSSARSPDCDKSNRKCNVDIATSTRPDDQQQLEPRLPQEAVKLLATHCKAILLITTLGVAWQSASASPAMALSVGWRPRRHHRRMGQQDRSTLLFGFGQAKKKPADARKQTVGQQQPQVQQVQEAVADAQAYVENLWRATKRRFGSKPGDEGFRLSAVMVPGRTGREVSIDPAVGYAAAAALGVTLLLLLLRSVGRKGRRRVGDGPEMVQIRDRSLGGRVVEIPKAEAPWRTEEETGSSRGGARGRAAAVTTFADVPTRTPSRPAPNAGRRPQERARPPPLPDWWQPPRITYSNSGRKERAQQDAQLLVREMEAWKYSGQDFPISSLLELRRTLDDTGGTVRARTEGGRDAMFRVGAEMAASGAMDPHGSHLGGTNPQTFVAGLARDLGVPDERAVVMTMATVAAKARSGLVSACASYREKDMEEVMVQLLRLAGLLNAFPPPPRSAEAEAVGAGLKQSFSLEERQAIFLTYGGMDYPTAAVLAEMLGFDPDLVMPQLKAHLLEDMPT